MSDLTSSDSKPRLPQEGDLVADRYLIGRKLGVGGMGIVVAATDRLLARSVALKFLLPRASSPEQSASRLMREAQSIARIRSEHVVRLMDVGIFRELPFLVMEYLDGEDLRRLVQHRGRLQLHVAVDYVLQALQAVAEAHSKAIVHRDLKANNLFLSRRPDGSPLIKVIDFGIAKTLEADALSMLFLTNTQEGVLGSPTHMSPEQLKNPRDVDCRTDIWALGVTFYELLTGRVPFAHDNYTVLIAEIATGSPARLRDSRPEIPHAFQDILDRCLEKDAERRIATALELAELLVPFGGADAGVSLSRIRGTVGGYASNDDDGHIAWPNVSFADTQPASAATPRTDTAWGSTSSNRRPSRRNSPVRQWRSVTAALTGTGALVGAGILVAHSWHGERNPMRSPPSAPTGTSIPSAAATPSVLTITVQPTVPGSEAKIPRSEEPAKPTRPDPSSIAPHREPKPVRKTPAVASKPSIEQLIEERR